MANTYLHKDIGRWKSGIIEPTLKLMRFWDRYNFDIGEFKARRIKKRERIANNELKNLEIKNI